MVVKARRSMTESPDGESDRYAIALEAVRALDRAASKGVLHPNNAARRKGRLARQMAKLAVAAPAPAGKGKKATATAARGKAAAPAKSAAPAKAASKKK
jgi:hypothetical protein